MNKHAFRVRKLFGLTQRNGRKHISQRGDIVDIYFKPLNIERPNYYDYDGDGVTLSPVTAELLAHGYIEQVWIKVM